MSILPGSLRQSYLNDDSTNYHKSHSYDPIPESNCQVKKRFTDKIRNRRDNRAIHSTEPTVKTIDCNNGGIPSRTQRSDIIPLLNTSKRWHSANEVRKDESGCEELIDRNNKSLGRNFIKSWLVGIFQGNKNPAPNGSNGGGLPANAFDCTSKPDRESIV